MSVLPTVLACVACDKITVVQLQSIEKRLSMGELIKMHAAHNLCARCRRTYNALAAQGRQAEFARRDPRDVVEKAQK